MTKIMKAGKEIFSESLNAHFLLEEEKRNSTFEANEIIRDGVVNTLIGNETITQKVADKYQLIEAESANRLLSVEQQLEQAATKTALAVEKARIDSFTTLAAGSTTGDAELIDGRTGADSKVYPNIGGAIRGQAIKSNIEVEDVSNAVGVVYSQFKLGGLDISANNIIEVSYLADRRVINPVDRPIKLRAGDIIKVKSPTNFIAKAYYKDNGTWTSSAWFSADYTIPVTSDYYLLLRTSAETVALTDYHQLSDNIVIVRNNEKSLHNAIASTQLFNGFAHPTNATKIGFAVADNVITVSFESTMDVLHFDESNEFAWFRITSTGTQIAVPNNAYLVVDIDTQSFVTLADISAFETGKRYIFCFKNHYGNVKGDWSKYVDANTIAANTTNIATNTKDIATNTDRVHAIGYRDLKMEYGNLDGLSESTYMLDRRVRTPVNNLVYLKTGDTVTLKDFSNALFYINHKTTGGTIVGSGALSAKYTVPEDGYYGIVIRKGAESTAIASVYELASLLQIETQSSIHQGVVEDGNWLPSYYYANGWMDNILAKIREKSRIKNGVTFAFVTDLHFPFNSKNSKYLLKKILRNTTVPYVICGGDFPEAYGSESALYEAGRNFVEYNNYIGKDSFFTIRGNHDFTIKTSAELATGATGTGATLPESTTYDYLMRNQERWVESNGGMYAYLDNKAQKTRIFLLNSCESGHSTDPTASWGLAYKVGQAQIDWLIANMTNVSGYKFIFISHVPADAAMVSYHPSQEIFHRLFVGLKNKTAVNYTADGETAIADFTGSTNTAVCNIHGHNHIDSSHVDNNFLSISTTADAHYTDDGWGAVKNTVTEQAIDVYCFDFDAGTINTVRVGRGNDRTWTY